MTLIYADMVAVLNKAGNVPSVTLRHEYTSKSPAEWDEWISTVKLTGFKRLDKLIITLGKNNAKLYNPISMDFLMVMTSKSFNRGQ